jgi:hypothetical protein
MDNYRITHSYDTQYIMTFISGVDSCLTAYYFIRSRYIVKRKSIFIIFVSLCIAIASIVLNAIHEDTKPWTNGEIYYGAMYYGACSTIEDDNSRLRCRK